MSFIWWRSSKTLWLSTSRFVADPHNVRLGLCSDGFNLYTQSSSSPYFCWPIIITPYNLPPEMCMSKTYMFLSFLISDSCNLKANIDVYLEPLIDDLKKLQSGVLTYDMSRKQNSTMKETLMWTINDFPAYDILFGWRTHARFAFPHCVEHNKSFRLHHMRKSCWFDSHRRFLPNDHPFRTNKKTFKKGEEEQDGPPLRLTPHQVWCRVRNLPKVTKSGVFEPDKCTGLRK